MKQQFRFHLLMTLTLALTLILTLGVILPFTASQSARAENRLSPVINKILPCMVKIFGAGGISSLESYGTGFLISSDGHFVTVWSHVLDTDRVRVVLADGQRLTAQIVDFDPHRDLALLKLDGDFNDLPHINLEEITTANVGTRVLAFSNMFKVATGNEPVSVMHGVIASRTELEARRGSYEVPFAGPVYIVDAPTNNSGAAGGVLTDYQGQVIAMIGKELRNSETNTWVHYAMPIEGIAKAATAMKAGNYDGREGDPLNEPVDPKSRIKTRDLGFILVPDVVARTPAYVDRVLSETPAAEVGIQPDDLILFINDQIVPSIEDVMQVMARLEEFDDVKIILRRGDQILTLEFSVPVRED
ncbi:putative periplasmic serine endoprotease DegP-like precursor [Polystyrenella longa]|uniref:Putative periplasmic serine endoprotease DegP-like n=1 Tax=Polystyrenella longa TaxID=2528007 RepID=A0A518CKF0_9PLAN|nr:serine protease [Polystyrenella longa]QDU79703.1 putative periplasmic serine endoprotease DegP-like precursor [Polystyrenella longa]